MEADILQNRTIFFVFEYNIFEVYAAFHGGQGFGIFFIGYGNRLVHQLEDTLQIGYGVDQLVVIVGKLLDGIPEAIRVTGHGNQHTYSDGITQVDNTNNVDQVEHSFGNDHGKGPDAVVNGNRMQIGLFRSSSQFFVDTGVHFFTGKTLGHTLTIDALSQIRGKVTLLIGLQLPSTALFAFNTKNVNDEDRQTGKYHQSQLGIQRDHEDRNEEKAQYLQQNVYDTIGQKVRYRVNIVDNTHQNLTMRTAIEIIEGQILQMHVQVAAQIANDGLTGNGRAAGTEAVTGSLNDYDHNQ